MTIQENTPAQHTHVIVGDGITAAAFAEAVRLRAGDHLVLVGKNVDRFGCGAAYAPSDPDVPWRNAYLLNSPADDIDPAFARWLAERWDTVAKSMAGLQPDWLTAAQPLLARGDTYGLNAPRAFYGDFMMEQVTDLFTKLRQTGVTITRHRETAVLMERDGERIRIQTDTGRPIHADSVDVAPGGPATQRMEGDESPFSAPTLFGYETEIAEHVKAGVEIFCIGSNATMLDALRLCQSLVPNEKLRFVACSPSGSLPAPLIPRLPRTLTRPYLRTGHRDAKSFLADVWSAMEKARADGDEMREIRAGFRAFFIDNGLHQFLASDSEARQVPRTLRHWFRGGTRDTILDFHRLMKQGVTRTLAGSVFQIETTATGARVHTRDKAGNTVTHDTGFVINCSGAGPNSPHDPLTEHMRDQGWIDTCSISGGLEVGAQCHTKLKNVRHLSPATTVIGNEIMPMPLYDAHLLRTWAKRAHQAEGSPSNIPQESWD